MLELPPDTDDKVLIELWVRKEEIDARIRACSLRIQRSQPDADMLELFMQRHEDMIRNLRSPSTPVISLREYVKIINDLKKMKKLFRDTTEYIRAEEYTIQNCTKEKEIVLSLMERRINPQNLIQFRPRGIVK